VTRLIELLSLLEQKALDDKAAGRLVWGDEQLELVKLVRQLDNPQATELWAHVRACAEGSDWNREVETLPQWAYRKLRPAKKPRGFQKGNKAGRAWR
jgi:hypothetical protein